MEDAYALVESLYIRSIYVHSHAREKGQFYIQLVGFLVIAYPSFN